jgi:acetyl esterase/lipase
MAMKNRRSWCAAAATSFVVSLACTTRPARAPDAGVEHLMTPEELMAIPTLAPDHRIAYGTEPSHYGELRIPAGRGPHPLVVLIHGGCFKAAFATAKAFGAMADALKADGIASWNIEYRRLGEPGSGWPGTYLDVGHGVDHVRAISNEYHLDLARVAVVGHSAGGHLAMWTAARSRLNKSSELYVGDPLSVRGVMNLAGPVDMTANIPGYEALCGDPVVTSLLGGTPADVPEHYAQASAIKLLPLAIPQVFVVGSHEEFVPLPLVDAYVAGASAAGDHVQRILIPGAGHFEIASPRAFTWPQVKSAIVALLDGELPS